MKRSDIFFKERLTLRENFYFECCLHVYLSFYIIITIGQSTIFCMVAKATSFVIMQGLANSYRGQKPILSVWFYVDIVFAFKEKLKNEILVIVKIS